MKIEEQEKVLENNKKNMLVSASAGSGKTYIMIKYITQLICEKKIPVENLLVLTFTKAAATEMKERLQKRLKEKEIDQFVIEQIDALSTANISTIHAFCEKSLKKYANLLEINENFEIADENLSQKIRQTAFNKAIKKFQTHFSVEYDQILTFYKNDKDKIKDIVFEIEPLINAVADKDLFVEKNMSDAEMLFDKAANYLAGIYKEKIKNIYQEVEKLHIADFALELEKAISALRESSDLFEMSIKANEFRFPTLPKRREVGDEVVNKLNTLKKNILKLIAQLKELNLQDDETVAYQRTGVLEKNVLKLFKIYENEAEVLKKTQNLLDFYDLEKYMKILSEKENLFAGLKYVFIDEYQDTNKVQERIIKNIARNCNFVAVGDVKQGIYGFRLASSEIFLKDMEDFEQEENSAVNYLKSNFRSDQRVLDFINDIFKVCMTRETSGVDYEESSMLVGRADFVNDGQKAVTIDIVKEKEEKLEILPEVYSVKNANLSVNQKNKNTLFAVVKRIVEVLETKISDDGQLRPCKYSDIAILSRKRDDLFNELEAFLQNVGIPVVSTSRNILMSEPEIQALKNYLKIALNLDDDIALLSVLLSGLCEVSVQEILDEKVVSDKSLCEILVESKNQNLIKFLKNLNDFRKNLLIFGAKKAFLDLFNKTNYRAFINLKPNHQKLNTFIDKFLNEIVSSGFEFDVAGLVNYFETVEISVSTESAGVDDAVLLTTIHNSKGLEYPVVFLIGCDQSMKKNMQKADVEINESFGLALKCFDLENNQEVMTLKTRAIREFEAEKSFAEELMIFYVALTRAKNRLYLFGKEKEYHRFILNDCDSYYDLIFYALKKDGEDFENENIRICNVEILEEKDLVAAQNFENSEVNPTVVKKLNDYLDFRYKFDELTNFKLKETVTSLNQKNQEDKLEKFSNENFSFGGASVEVGNAYHLALKTINFERVEDCKTLEEELCANAAVLSKSIEMIDKRVLLNNILLLKPFCENAKVFKEKEFILKDKLKNLINETQFDDEILVQGVVDFFALKNGEGVLIDYKYSNSTSDSYLLNKYINQLRIYKIALEKALKIKINEIYLLSLKAQKLIKTEIN